MITLKYQLVFRRFKKKKKNTAKVSSTKETEDQAHKEHSVEKLLSLQSSPPYSLFPSISPLGTFNGVKLWVSKSHNNCLGLKHNSLTGVTQPFSPPPLALRSGHLFLRFKRRPQWQAIFVRRHFLCHYPLTHWLLWLSYWQTGKNIKEYKSTLRVGCLNFYINAH